MPLANITWLDGNLVGGPVDPGYGVGTPGGRPDNSLPGSGGRPNNDLPWAGWGSTLPVYPFDPSVDIDNSLPEPPPVVRPGMKFVVKYAACKGLILVPDNSLPEHAQPK